MVVSAHSRDWEIMRRSLGGAEVGGDWTTTVVSAWEGAPKPY